MTLPNYLLSIMLLCPTLLMFGGQIRLPNTSLGPSQDVSCLKIEMRPSGSKEEAAEKTYRVGSKVYMRVIARNDTDQRVRIIVVDTHYQNRPQLFKEGELVPYREQVKKLVHAKDNDPEFIRPGSVVFLEPYSSKDLEELNLSDWYDSLKPGLYRLINRHRFDLDGPWTADSAPLLFQVVAQ
jgi:hypothetical protein